MRFFLSSCVQLMTCQRVRKRQTPTLEDLRNESLGSVSKQYLPQPLGHPKILTSPGRRGKMCTAKVERGERA